MNFNQQNINQQENQGNPYFQQPYAGSIYGYNNNDNINVYNSNNNYNQQFAINSNPNFDFSNKQQASFVNTGSLYNTNSGQGANKNSMSYLDMNNNLLAKNDNLSKSSNKKFPSQPNSSNPYMNTSVPPSRGPEMKAKNGNAPSNLSTKTNTPINGSNYNAQLGMRNPQHQNMNGVNQNPPLGSNLNVNNVPIPNNYGRNKTNVPNRMSNSENTKLKNPLMQNPDFRKCAGPEFGRGDLNMSISGSGLRSDKNIQSGVSGYNDPNINNNNLMGARGGGLINPLMKQYHSNKEIQT